MTTLAWITVGGVVMSALALTGSATLLLPERLFDRVVPPLVALAAGTLLGGACFHMLPEAVDALGNRLGVYVWLVAGFVGFFVLEQYLHWHHCHQPLVRHGPLGYLILVADGLHNLIGGLAVGAAFLVDVQVGLVTWAAAAAHEVPQELGDFGILVHAGWSRSRALLFNFASALTFLVGGLLAYALAGRVEVVWLLPFAAGNFLYISAADLIPELTKHPGGARKAWADVHVRARLGRASERGVDRVAPRDWRATWRAGHPSRPSKSPMCPRTTSVQSPCEPSAVG